ncbi:hypothetical protein [Nocardia panacis]|uniref:hypothetical protein n=1 Tax=Nocardia panacis TaxID=2340916 RepID=UPI0013157E8C|nr:hypothetical protein [Nocardia panacis]
MELSIGDARVGSTVAGPDGAFRTSLAAASAGVGRYEVSLRCGASAVAPLDVVLVSRVDTGTSTLIVIVFALLLGGGLFARRVVSDAVDRRRS